LLQQGHIQLVAQDCVQMGFEYSGDGNSTASLGNLCQCSVTLTMRKCFLMFGRNLLVFQFLLIVSGLIREHHWKKNWLIPLCTLPSGIYIH